MTSNNLEITVKENMEWDFADYYIQLIVKNINVLENNDIASPFGVKLSVNINEKYYDTKTHEILPEYRQYDYKFQVLKNILADHVRNRKRPIIRSNVITVSE